MKLLTQAQLEELDRQDAAKRQARIDRFTDAKSFGIFTAYWLCNTCGAVIMDKDTHHNWHIEQDIQIG